MDVAQLGRQQHAQEQRDGQAHAQRQCTEHGAAAAPVVARTLLVFGIATSMGEVSLGEDVYQHCLTNTVVLVRTDA